MSAASGEGSSRGWAWRSELLESPRVAVLTEEEDAALHLWT